MAMLPEYLETQEEDQVLDRMLSLLPDDLDKAEGSFLWDANAPASVELVIANERLKLALEWTFAQTSFAEFLDLRAEEHGVLRRPPTLATGEVLFTGQENTVIPEGTEVSTPSTETTPSQSYVTDQAAIIGATGEVLVPVTAVEAGAAGNVGADQVTLFPEGELEGVTGVTNPEPMANAVDEESDEALLDRLLLRVRNPGSSGNVADYRNWALEVPGVGFVAVVPLEGGPGTVTIAIAGVTGVAAGPATISAVQEYIAPDGPNGGGLAPIGADVTVEAATENFIGVTATLTISDGYDPAEVEDRIVEAIQAYLRSLIFQDDNDVRHARIVTAILDTEGVIDATDVLLNGGIANVAIGTKEIAILGSWTFS